MGGNSNLGPVTIRTTKRLSKLKGCRVYGLLLISAVFLIYKYYGYLNLGYYNTHYYYGKVVAVRGGGGIGDDAGGGCELGKPLMIDCIQYNGEDIVPYRLELLYDAMDFFYITESNITFSGAFKPLARDGPRGNEFRDSFRPYRDKVRWIHDYVDEADISGKNNTASVWKREYRQRSHGGKAVARDFPDGNFLLFGSDADEIVDPALVQQIRDGYYRYHCGGGQRKQQRHRANNNNNDSDDSSDGDGRSSDEILRAVEALLSSHLPIVSLEMMLFYYNFNWHVSNWNRAFVMSGGELVSGRHDTESARRGMKKGRHIVLGIKKREKYHIVSNAGWHGSYFMTVDQIQNKLRSFSHQKYNTPHYTNPERIRRCIATGQRLFDDDTFFDKFDSRTLPLPLQRFHEKLTASQNISDGGGGGGDKL